MNHSKKLVVLCLSAVAAFGCGSPDSEIVEQGEQELQNIPKSIEQARAEALRAAAAEFKDALKDMRHENQTHDAQREVSEEIKRLEAEARHWEARIPKHPRHGH